MVYKSWLARSSSIVAISFAFSSRLSEASFSFRCLFVSRPWLGIIIGQYITMLKRFRLRHLHSYIIHDISEVLIRVYLHSYLCICVDCTPNRSMVLPIPPECTMNNVRFQDIRVQFLISQASKGHNCAYDGTHITHSYSSWSIHILLCGHSPTVGSRMIITHNYL